MRQRREQSRAMSMVESFANVAVGYVIAVLTQILMFPLFGIEIGLAENMAIGMVFVGVSLARTYCLRRLFNRMNRSADRPACGPES